MSNHSFELIPLVIETRGEVISNNVGEFREMVRGALELVNSSPSTDEEFGQAELDTKALKGAEDRIAAAKDKALADAKDLYALLTELDETSEEIRACRLSIEKAVAQRKEEIKDELISAAMEKLICAPRLRQSMFGKSVADSIKGKRTLDSMRKALDVVVAVHNGTLEKNRASISSFSKTHGEGLVPDADELETKSPDSVEGELRRRFEARKTHAERKRLEGEAAAAKAELAASKPPLLKGMLPPCDLPKPPKIGSIQVGGGNVVPFSTPSEATTVDGEWAAFKAAVFTSFGQLKSAKDTLNHAENIIRAGEFAKAVNAAWQSANEPMAMPVRKEVAP